MDESPGNWHMNKKIEGTVGSILYKLTLRRSPTSLRSPVGLAATILFFIFFAFLLFNCPSVEAGTAFVSEGHTQMSNQRKVIANEYGFWVFFSSNPVLVSNPP